MNFKEGEAFAQERHTTGLIEKKEITDGVTIFVVGLNIIMLDNIL